MQRLPVRPSRSLRSWFLCGISGGLALLLWLAGGVLVAQATDRCVDPTGAGGCYTTIQDAVSVAASGDTIIIAAGTYKDGTVSVSRKNLSFVGAGTDQTFVDGNHTSSVFITSSGAQIELSNLTVQNGYSAASNGAGIYAINALKLTNVDVLSNTAVGYYAGGVYVQGSLFVSNTRFISNTATTGGGVYALSNTNITNSRFEHNVALAADGNGGGLYMLPGSTLAVTGTDFISNTAHSGGGVASSVGVVMKDVTFEGNYAEQYAGLVGLAGGAVLSNTDFLSNTSTGGASGGAYLLGNVQITGGRYLGNSCATCSGGALNVKTGTISGTVFISNTSATGGGAIYVGGTSGTAVVTVTNGYFERNVCTNFDCMGGGMYANAPVTLVDTDFYSNTGGTGNYGGGGLYGIPGATITGGQFRYNAGFNGGGLSSGLGFNTTFVISGTQFIGNTASITGTGGGAVYSNPNTGSSVLLVNVYAAGNSAKAGGAVYAGRTMTVTGSVFEHNSATDAGGALSAGTSSGISYVISDTQFLSNTSLITGSGGGGALYFYPGANSSALLVNVRAANNSARAGGAIYSKRPITITGSTIENNMAISGSGGGLYASDAISIMAVEFANNTARGVANGGAIYHYSNAGQIVNSLFAGNWAEGVGDGYYRVNNANQVLILNSTFVTPTVTSGEAIYIADGTVQITNTLVASYTTGIQHQSLGTVTEDYNLFTGVITQTSGTVTGTHSLSSTNARFVDPDNGNYRLLTGSPAAGKGTNLGVLVDLDGNTRANPPSIGAYEGTAVPGGLSLTNAVSPTASVPFQGTLVYTLTLANGSAQSDPNAMITDTLPAGVTFQSWIQQPPGAVRSGSAITWTGTLADGAQLALVFAATNTASGGVTITNTAGFSGTSNAGTASAAYTTAADCYAASSGNWSTVFAACPAGAKRIIPAGIAVTLDVDVTLTGDFEVQTGATFTANGKTVTLTGSSAQTLTGNPLSFYKLVLNKDAKSDVVRIAGKLVVTKKLTITRGSLISASEYGDLEIEDQGVLTLTNPISITGSFTNSGDLYTEGHAVNFTGGLAAPVRQDLVLNVLTWFDDLNVMTGTTMVEAVTDDNAYVSGVLTNFGVIRKTQPIADATQYYFGLAGRYAGSDMEVDAAATGTLTLLQVDRIDANPAELPATAPLYWQITPLGAGYSVTLTLPHNGVTDPVACRRTPEGTWNCARSAFDATTVTRTNVTAFSDWAVFEQHTTTTTVAAGPNPSVFGQTVVFTATVDPAAVGGSVQFYAGGSALGSPQQLTGGVAVLTTGTLPVGSYTITATAAITTAAYLSSVGQLAGSQVVNKANTTTALASSVNPSQLGQEVTFTAMASAVTPAVGTPTGVVTFTVDGSDVGTAVLDASGVATYTTAALLGGTHVLTATYGGDGSCAGSTSQPYPQVVQMPLPLAVNDAAGTLQDTPVTVAVLANDLDPAGGGLTVAAITLQPANGTALPTADGKAVLYTPNAGFSGQDSFVYVAQDANGNSDDALATVVVAPKSQVGEPPQIAPVDPQVEITTPFTGTTAAVEVQLPAGFLTQTLGEKEILFLSYTPAMTPTEATQTPPNNLKFGNFEFDLTLFRDNEPQHGVQFAVPITVTIAYDPLIVVGLKEETLEVYYWDGTTWITSGITAVNRDLVNHSITIALSHLSQFGFFAQKTPTALDPGEEPQLNIKLFLPGVLREVTAAGPVEQAVEQPAEIEMAEKMYLPLLNK